MKAKANKKKIKKEIIYSHTDIFVTIISKAKTECEISKENIDNHFADVGKMVFLGSSPQKKFKITHS